MLTNKKAASILIIISIIIAVSINFYQAKAAYTLNPHTDSRIMLDTLVTIKAYGSDRDMVEKAVSDAMRRIDNIDKVANAYSNSSEISKVNATAFQGEVKLHPDLLAMIDLSLIYWRGSGGLFDVTIRPFVILWDIEKKQVPTRSQIDQSLGAVGSDKLVLDQKKGTIRFLNADTAIDLGAVAKGYAADQAVKVLEEAGIKNAIVTTGSTTSLIGEKPVSKLSQLISGIGELVGLESAQEIGFLVGIQHPRKESGKLLGSLYLKNRNISTSGDYQQYFIKNGERYHHIINPRTGMPAQGLESVTVSTTRSDAEADILSTALFVMGKERAIRWLKNNPDVLAVLVDDKGTVFVSRGLRLNIKGSASEPIQF